MEQLKDNIRIFEEAEANVMSQDELDMIAKVRQAYQSLIKVPCTGCGYCIPCPKGVDIPRIFYLYNNGNMYNDFANVVQDLSLIHICWQKQNRRARTAAPLPRGRQPILCFAALQKNAASV